MPSILEVISPYTELRRAGKEFIGLCPLHSENSPSFTVNEEKGLFYCHGCHAGGDALTFIQLLKGVDFKEARAILGLSDLPPMLRSEIKQMETLDSASKTLQEWALGTSLKVAEKMRILGLRLHCAKWCIDHLQQFDNVPLMQDLIESCHRQWMILEVLDDDLANPDLILSMWRQRKDVERLVDEA